MEAWREWFPHLLGLAITIIGFAVRRVVKKYDALNANVDTLMKERDVALAVKREVVERGHDRRMAARADAMDFYNMDEKRRGERRSEWPK